MTRIANDMARAYRSQLREEQVGETRVRILDATVRVIAGGIASASIPAVAREAGVSVPTVYRHFGTKRELIASVYPHVVRRAGLDRAVFPRSMDELRDGVRAYFDRFGSFDDLARAAMASPGADEARRINMPERIALARQLADSIVPRLSGRDRDRIARLLLILTTSSSVRMWLDHLGLSVDQAADEVEWVIRAAIAASTRKEQ